MKYFENILQIIRVFKAQNNLNICDTIYFFNSVFSF